MLSHSDLYGTGNGEARRLIDGSHMRASDFNYRIVRFAVLVYDFELDAADTAVYERAAEDCDRLISELSADDWEALMFLAEDAIDYMSDHFTDTFVYVEDSCLWEVYQ